MEDQCGALVVAGAASRAVVRRFGARGPHSRVRRSDTAFSATMMDDRDIKSAETSGRSDHPKLV